MPFLLGLACAANIGSAATLIGKPQNMLVGSIANLIVVDLAHKCGVVISWRMHAQVGVPVTLLTLALVWVSLHWR